MNPLARLRRYVEMRRAKPISGLDDVVHGVHTGTEWSAELRLSDLAAVTHPLDCGALLHAGCGTVLRPVVRAVSARPDDETWPRDFSVTLPYCDTCRRVVPFDHVRAAGEEAGRDN